MKKLFILLALLVAVPAYAGWNILQKDDGTAVWESGGATIGIAEVQLQVSMADISTASTEYVASPTTGLVSAIHILLMGDLTGNSATILPSVMSTTTPTIIGTEISNSNTTFTVATGSTQYTTTSFYPSSGNEVGQGGVIAINTDGASTGTAGMRVIISVRPK